MKTPTRMIETARLQMEVAEAGEGPAVVLLHGFPESWYSWRHQLDALADAGFRAIAPNQRGYGRTDAPEAIEAYDQEELALDVIALLDALDIERAVVVGHDWGSAITWHTALRHPDRVSRIVTMSIPHGGRAPAPPTSIFERKMGDGFFYMLYFQEPGPAEAELEANVRESLRVFYYSISGDLEPGTGFAPKPKGAKLFDTMLAPPGLPSWLGESDLDFYTREFERSGFRGPLNWYRNLDRNWERSEDLTGARITQPTLFLGGDRDYALMFSAGAMRRMGDVVPNLETTIYPGCGHWVQQERAAEVNEAVLRFLRRD